jgi:hypothetical protein
MPGKLTKKFTAHEDDGKPHEMHVFTEHLRGADGKEVVVNTLRTADGNPVSILGKGKYEVMPVIAPHFVVHSDDPDAP